MNRKALDFNNRQYWKTGERKKEISLLNRRGLKDSPLVITASTMSTKINPVLALRNGAYDIEPNLLNVSEDDTIEERI